MALTFVATRTCDSCGKRTTITSVNSQGHLVENGLGRILVIEEAYTCTACTFAPAQAEAS